MEDTPATRQATKSRIGPWYVLQSRNPAAPGMKHATLMALVAKGQVTARSIVRGPTTYQLWRFAAHVRGLSREFGLCYSCGETVEKSAVICPRCERSQEAPANPDALLEVRGESSNGNGNGHGRNGATREYELPAQPAAYVPVAGARGEHAERLRTLNENAANRTRPALARDGRMLSAMELASALQPDAAIYVTRPRSLKRIVGLLILAGLIGGGVFLYFNPAYRERGIAWSRQQWQRARDQINSFELQKPPHPLHESPAPAAPTVDMPQVVAPLITEAPTPPPAPKPDPIVEQPRHEAPPAVTQTPTGSEGVLSTDAAIKRSRELWFRANQAESREDYAEAIRCYDEIKRLPQIAWPAGLQLRMDLAKRQLPH